MLKVVALSNFVSPKNTLPPNPKIIYAQLMIPHPNPSSKLFTGANRDVLLTHATLLAIFHL